jgi:hypothetical protein
MRVLPAGCQPIITTDAGFRGPWFKAVSELGWDFIGRLRNNVKLAQTSNPSVWHGLGKFFYKATKTPTSAGQYLMGKSESAFKSPVQIVTVTERLYRNTSRKKAPRGSAPLRDHVKAAREPWVLATSLSVTPGQVVLAYEKRMQIEETFRDIKGSRFGWSMTYTTSKNPKRLSVLLLIAALSHYVAFLVGAHAETHNLHRSYQANTRRYRVLSFARLGELILYDVLLGRTKRDLPPLSPAFSIPIAVI